MSIPLVTQKVGSVLRGRVCNTKHFVANTDAQIISGYDNNRQGVIIQNKSSTINGFISFNQSNSTAGAILVPPTGSISFDFAIAETLYAFSESGTIQMTVLEVSGFDTFQLLMARLVEQCVDRLGMGVDLMTLIARQLRASETDIAKARKSEI